MAKKIATSVTLIITERCNLNCIYCYEHNKSAKSMDFLTAKNILEKELLIEDGIDDIFINLFGGEAFLNFDLIRKIYDFIYGNNWKKNITISISTNGTLVHDDIKQWLYDRKENINCGISLDGTKSMHDYNRCNSFDDIDLEFFAQTWKNQKAKMTVSQKSLNNLSDGVIFLHTSGFRVACNLAFGIDWSDSSLVEVLKRELLILVNYYLENPDVEPCGMLSLPINLINDVDKSTVKKWCGVGTRIHTYDIDGKCYPCQFFLPLAVGEEKARDAETIVFLQEIPKNLLSKECSVCRVADACPTCCGSNYIESGNIYMKNSDYCKFMKPMIIATSYLQYQKWQRGQLTLTESEEYILLRSIKIIQETLGGM
ncbi:radical SAM protein [Anaerocolumna xylanovorans]|uniref:Radical SAM additional 4Fe4S-binding SPASM domain-containing protein n=1 Tax=Anaerocolumna xylanovorans DSM 12503 TaxID=1121345 RepID=A0A1M7Y5J0_9FIRM|nr:radical SAM protein [Anaerocolumna xylanovorans]SHO47769.1 radical SAM additional 4Fe4S-binding SPASM domain-containing protein [Anaerocolumna xylanovorans DSM 12503]